ncbi:ATP/GTP-binding protein [Serratia quinivorans]|uniref:ATP/GTP-binding protein n=1 Tax=Serratia quinivorans TaxID=137545 RepID=UPI0034C5EE9F
MSKIGGAIALLSHMWLNLDLVVFSLVVKVIHSYGLKNYFSFKDGADVSFKLNNKVPEEVSKGKNISTVLGVKGANGSGKTNLLKSLGFLSVFCTESFQLKEDEKIHADSYFRSENPSEFYIEFTSNNTFYRYEVGVTRTQVIYERLYRKLSKKSGDKTTRTVLILDRKENSIIDRLDELSYLDVILLKSNASVISTAYNYKLSGDPVVIHDLHGFFSSIKTNVGYTGLKDYASTTENIYVASSFYKNNEEAFSFVKKIIIDSDLGISDIEIRTRTDEDGKEIDYPIFEHEVAGGNQWLTSFDESSGTKSLYVKLALYWLVIKIGGVLVMDEFDINCHAFMLPRLVALFTDENININDAQFIFTSHNTEIIDTLGKYRTYLVNKECNESYCYRLDEIKGDILRSGRLISPVYKEGKIGGVPKL